MLDVSDKRFVLPEGLHKLRSFELDGLHLSSIRSDADDAAESSTSDHLVLPGFIDVHIHGAVGVDVNTADAGGLMKVAEFLAKHGVTAWMPTLVPDSDDAYRRVIEAINELMVVQVGKPIAQAVGVHYEGVWANEAMCGALRPQYFKSDQWSVVSGQLPASENHPVSPARPGCHPSFVRRGAFSGLPKLDSGIHMTTLAPEIDGGIELIRELVSDGWIVSIGHTQATPDVLDAALEAGARHMTHFFNAMTGVHHRDVGVAGWGLSRPDVTFDIIADGIHVHPDMLRLACRAKTPAKVSLISDSVAPTGLGDGEFELWDEKISVVEGRTRNERGSIAGSVITMHDAVRRMLSLGFTNEEVSQMASTNPARLLGLEDRGAIEVGKRADLVGLNVDGYIEFVMIGGERIETTDKHR